MKRLLLISLLVPLVALASGEAPKLREHKIALTDTREVIVAVPDGFLLVPGETSLGVVGARLSASDDSISMELQFLPDPEGKYASARARMELMHEMFSEYVDDSTEKAMEFEELEPKLGAGTYCVFTDAKLVGKTEFPPGEYLHLTTGVKAWPGVVALFRCFSNEIKSSAYKAVLTMLRESVHEKPAPLK